MKNWLLLMLLVPTLGYSQLPNDPLNDAIQEISYGEDTLKAIFDWVAQAIDYDVALIEAELHYTSEEDVIREALTGRKGVCLHYASLFKHITQRLGYESLLISGYTRQQNKINDELSHAWNAVKVDGSWYLFDPTWSSGYVDDNQFFKNYDDVWYKVPPEQFIRTHIPFDPIWQLMPYPLTHFAIQAGRLDIVEESLDSFADSLALHYDRDTLAQLQASVKRIKKFGQTNRLIQRRIAELNQQIMITEYNQASDVLNTVVNDFNQYIAAKNNRFRHPKLSDKELKDISESLNHRIDITYPVFNSLVPVGSLSMQRLQENQKTIENIRQRIQQESAFIERYLKTWKLFRAFAFH